MVVVSWFRMTSLHLDSRNKSGFYTLLEDEMFGKGLTNIGQHNTDSKISTVIRSYGALWYNFENQTVRMYLYETRGNVLPKLGPLNMNLKPKLSADQLKKLPPPDIQHAFAEDDGTIRDTVLMWTSFKPLFHVYDDVNCMKLAKVTHCFEDTKTAFDFHVLIQRS